MASLYASHWFNLSTSRMIQYMHQSRCAPAKRQFVLLRRFKLLQYFLLLVQLLRALYLSELVVDSMADHLPYNPLMTGVRMRLRFLNGGTMKAACLMIIFSIYLDYIIYFKLDHFLLNLFHQLVIDNAAQFLSINKKVLSVPRWNYFKPLHSTREWYHLQRQIWHSNNLQFKLGQLDSFPNISTRLRARMFVYSSTIDWLFATLNAISALTVATFGVAMLALVYHEVPIWVVPIAIIDDLFLCYCARNPIRMCLVSIHCGFCCTFLSNLHLAELSKALRLAVQQLQLAMLKYRFMNLFYREYHQQKYIAEYANRQFVSTIMWVTLLTNTFLNVVMIGNLFFKQLYISEQIGMCLLIVIQTLLVLQGCSVLIAWSKAFYTSEHILFSAQQLLTRRDRELLYQRTLLLTAKVKLMTFYELVCTTSEFRFTVGPFGRISMRSSYEFLYVYSGIVMYVSTMVHNSQLAQKKI